MAQRMLALALLLLCCGFSCSRVLEASQCGYESCNKEKEGMINVHLVPHTHDDVGWLMTVDQYYYKEVQYILDGVVAELAADPSKRFIYVEIAFFARWFNEQDDSTRHLVQSLVNEGRLEFILGGWCMNDEAVTHYSAIIDQHKLGFEFLRYNFGDCARPKIGWQIDPFGHSREQASLFAQFGFDGLFFGRLDYQDKDQRQKDKTMEFLWKGSPQNLGKRSDLFTGVLPNMYQPPAGYWFDMGYMYDHPEQTVIMDDPRLHDYNVKQMVDGFIKATNDQAKNFATKHLIMTMGSDFNYIQAHMYFKNLDKLIKYVNEQQSNGSNINVLYSTPSCYLKALNDDDRTWTTKEDDFFPYADRDYSFWTGFFTSRPTQKRYTRVVNSYFQAVKQMAALAKLDNTFDSGVQLQHLAEVLGVAQHHDGITGTEKQAVAYDYEQRLADGVNGANNVINDVYGKLMYMTGSTPPQQSFCPLMNISICDLSGSTNNFQVTFYNPLARPVTYVARIPVNGMSFQVLGQDGVTKVPFDVQSVIPSNIPNPNGETPTGSELVFPVKMPALGYVTYHVVPGSETDSLKFKKEKSLKFKPEPTLKKGTWSKVSAQNGSIEGKYYRLTFEDNGRLLSITNKTSGVSVPLNQNYLYYKGFEGNCSDGKFQASGAYIFRPMEDTATDIPMTYWTGTIGGQVVQEVWQDFSETVMQVFRVYEDKPYVEVEWTVGPIPINDNVGKEVVVRYNVPSFNNKGVFYTDSNGREILERRLNYRPTWKFNQTEPVSGNYYPINALIGIRDEDKGLQFTVLTDRSEGGTSLNNGDVEIMLHRRLLHDDAKGVGEALNETGSDGKGLVVRGTHYLMLDTIGHAASVYRPMAQEVFLTPQISFSALKINPQQYAKEFNTNFTGLRTPLPPNVHLLSLEQFRHNGPVQSPAGTVPYLIRLEHFYELGEDPKLSMPVTFDIQNLFTPFTVTDVHELSLGANMPIEEMKRLKWKTADESEDADSLTPIRQLKATTVTLQAMHIVTLQANIKLQ